MAPAISRISGGQTSAKVLHRTQIESRIMPKVLHTIQIGHMEGQPMDLLPFRPASPGISPSSPPLQ